MEDFLSYHAEAEDRDEWTDPRFLNPGDAGQEGDRVSLNQKWWILLFMDQGKAYRVKPTYRPARRPRSRTGSPFGTRWRPQRNRSGGLPQAGSRLEPRLHPPPIGGEGEKGPRPWAKLSG